MALSLYRHNEEAYDRAAGMLSASGRAAVIHPTGTGKSYIAFRLIEEHPGEDFLWLSPSRYIMELQQENLRREVPGFNMERVQFMTYARLMMMTDAEIDDLACDYIILDEFHRCGAEQWGQGVRRLLENYRATKYLGLTATHIRYLDAGRDMAEELFGENVASEMTLGEAIARGILPVPEYITSVYRYNAELEEYQRRIDRSVPSGLRGKAEKELEKLRRSLSGAERLDELFRARMRDPHGKYIIFCSSWEHLQEVREHIGEWFRLVDDAPHCYILYSGEAATEKEFAAFCEDESEHLRVMLCINRLNEGIHIPGLSGVILFRPTASPIIYKQQIGRALTAGGKQPVIFDIVGNFESLMSIGTVQYEIASAAEKLRENGHADEVVVDRFEIDGRTMECMEMIRRLEKSINSHWEDYYEAARAYYEEKGDLLIPHKYTTDEGLQLGAWIWTQRSVYRTPGQTSLTEEQIEKLERIGMVWQGMHELSWERAYEEARKYYEKNGDLNAGVEYRTESGFALGVWLNNQRQKTGEKPHGRKLSREKMRRLEEIGMVWEVRSQAWEAHCAEAKAYYEAHGNLDIPGDYRTEDGFLLGMWLIYQRKTRLEKWQKEELEKIGMRWESGHDRRWMRGYQAAKAYYEENGHLDIPYGYKTEDGLALGRWLRKQRDAKIHAGHCNCVLTGERIRLLNEIGMIWKGNGDLPEAGD